ncbi:MAG: RNA repair domain-containing protein [Candidatus Bathyarchaeota archaeon]|nr:RNA repair domain-containing protein [Candidatus Bathyarchaeota archaeon]
MTKVRNLLNKILWDKRERPEDYEITFIHRGAYMNRRTIPCKSITGVEPSWFIYRNEAGEDIMIPFHRVTEIRNVKNNEIAYKSRKAQKQ